MNSGSRRGEKKRSLQLASTYKHKCKGISHGSPFQNIKLSLPKTWILRSPHLSSTSVASRVQVNLPQINLKDAYASLSSDACRIQAL